MEKLMARESESDGVDRQETTQEALASDKEDDSYPRFEFEVDDPLFEHIERQTESMSEDKQKSREETSTRATQNNLGNISHIMSCRQYETLATAAECGLDVSSLAKPALGLLCLVCAEHNFPNGVRALVTAGALKTVRAAPFGWTALQAAAWKGHLEIVKILRAGGWDMSAVDDWGRSAMHLAVMGGHLDIVEELLGEVDVRHGDSDGNTPLHFAAATGGTKIVSHLIKAGAVVNKTDAGDVIPLHFACTQNRLEAAKRLIEAGSSLVKKDVTGASPLHYTARYDSKDVLDYLLTLDTDINVKAADGSTPLHHAARYGSVSVLVPLLDAGADPSIVDNHGKSAVEVAVSHKNLDVVKLLIKRSQIRWEAHRSSHILFRAFQSKDSQIAALVLSTMMSELREKKVRNIIRKMYSELLADLLTDQEATVSVYALLVPYLPKHEDVRYKLAHHILMSCIKHSDNTELAESLVKIEPVMARQVTFSSFSPLHSACKHGRRAMVKLLLRYGANVGAKALDPPVTPLDLAREFSPDSGIAEMIERCEAVRDAVKRYPQSRLAWVELQQEKSKKSQPHGAGFTIHNVPWMQRVRKEAHTEEKSKDGPRLSGEG